MQLCIGIHTAASMSIYLWMQAFMQLWMGIHTTLASMQLYLCLYTAMGKLFSHCMSLSSHGRKTWVTEAENKSRKLHGNCFEEFCLTFKNCFQRTTNSKQFSENIFWILSEILVTEKFFPEIVWNCFEMFEKLLSHGKRDLSHGKGDLSHGNGT